MSRSGSRPLSIGPAIRHHRLSAGLTQAQLADAVGVAHETASRIETGRLQSVALKLCSRLANALGVTPADLLAAMSEASRGEVRDAERTLLALVSRLDKAEVRDLVRAIRLLARLARKLAPRP